MVQGIGEKKVKRLYQALHTPFKRKKSRNDDTIDATEIGAQTTMLPLEEVFPSTSL